MVLLEIRRPQILKIFFTTKTLRTQVTLGILCVLNALVVNLEVERKKSLQWIEEILLETAAL